jgi:hypothetical protein
MLKGSKKLVLIGIIAAASAIPVLAGLCESAVRPETLKLGVSENVLQHSPDFVLMTESVEHAEKGYGTLALDDAGAAFVARCRGGKCVSIQVLFGDHPAAREVAIAKLQRLLPAEGWAMHASSPAITEHDDSELVNNRCPEPTEFLYFDRDYKSEIGYSKSQPGKVSWVNAWYDRQHRDRI